MASQLEPYEPPAENASLIPQALRWRVSPIIAGALWRERSLCLWNVRFGGISSDWAEGLQF